MCADVRSRAVARFAHWHARRLGEGKTAARPYGATLLAAVVLVMMPAARASAQHSLISLYGPASATYLSGTETGTPAHGTFTAVARPDMGIEVVFRYTQSTRWPGWRFVFVAPFDAPLTPGRYNGVGHVASTSRRQDEPGMFVDRLPYEPWCDVRGDFTVLEVEYGPRGTVTRFAVNFRLQCTSDTDFLVGSVRFNATPRPTQQVSVTTGGSGGGAVASIPSGLSCGAACTMAREDGLFTVLVPTPLTGRGFTWTGDSDCRDGVLLDGGSASCQLTYEPCAFSLDATSVAMDTGDLAYGRVRVTANGPACAWTIDRGSSAAWLFAGTTTASPVGSQNVTLQTLRTNSSQPRSSTIRLAGQVLTVTQPGLTPTFAVTNAITAGAAGGQQFVTITSNVIDPPWTATSTADWVVVPAAGLTPSVPVTVLRNPTRVPRVASLVIAGQTVLVTQGANGVPGEPTGLTATVQHGAARFRWHAPQTEGDASSYRLEAGLSRGTTVATFAASEPTLDLAGVPDGRFFIRVRGINEFGVGVASDDYVLEVRGGLNPPDPPTSFQVTSWAPLRLSWAAPPGGGPVEGYVLVAGSRSGASDFAQVPLGLATSFALESPPAGTYFLSVRAVNRAGTSRPSDERLRQSSSYGPPGHPVDLTAAVSGTTVTFTWKKNESIWSQPSSYRLAVGASPGRTDLTVDTRFSYQTSLAFAGVPPGRYYVRVHGISSSGDTIGPASNEVYVHVR
jgi:hypothetical protein